MPENYSTELWTHLVSIGNSFVIEKNNTVIGYCACNDKGDIFSLAVLKEYRKCGYGEQVLLTALNHLRSTCKTSELWVRSKNTGAQRLYKKLGFTVSKMIPMGYDDEDAIVMVKLL